MEPRAALFEYDAASERFTAHVQSQGVYGMRNNLAAAMGVPNEKMRVLTGQVGGSFGMKGSVFPEYIALLHAARDLKRPIKWSETRSESFVSDHQGRDHDIDAELALDDDGRFLALRMNGFGNLGAYVTPFGILIAAINIHRNAQSVYRTPLIETNIRCVVTNTPPIGAYRGAGRPEGNYIMERMIEEAARVSGHRFDRAAPAQSHSRRRIAVHDRDRLDLRQRRLSRPARRRAEIGRLGRLRRAQGRQRSARQTARARRRRNISKSPRRRPTNSARSISRTTAA